LDLPTNPISFGNQLVRTSSNTSSVVLTNSGTAPLVVSAVSVNGDFSQTNNCSSIPAGGQCSVAVTFTPTQTGTRPGELSISDNAGKSPQLIPLSGTGTDFTLQAASGSELSATVTPGATATYNVAVTPISGFTGTVALNCTGAPSGSACTSGSTSVNVSGSPVSVTVSVTTPAASSLLVPLQLRPLAVVVIPLGTFALMAGNKRWKLLLRIISLGLLLFFVALAGCGGGGNAGDGSGGNTGTSPTGGTTPPAPVTTMLTLSGVSQTQTRTVTLALTVQ
jgi:hypothetical protein